MLQVEKIAKLIGLAVDVIEEDGKVMMFERRAKDNYLLDYREFNPRTNKVDLLDVIGLLDINIYWVEAWLVVSNSGENGGHSIANFKDFENNKAKALANAVCDLAEKMFDRKLAMTSSQ